MTNVDRSRKQGDQWKISCCTLQFNEVIRHSSVSEGFTQKNWTVMNQQGKVKLCRNESDRFTQCVCGTSRLDQFLKLEVLLIKNGLLVNCQYCDLSASSIVLDCFVNCDVMLGRCLLKTSHLTFVIWLWVEFIHEEWFPWWRLSLYDRCLKGRGWNIIGSGDWRCTLGGKTVHYHIGFKYCDGHTTLTLFSWMLLCV